MREKPSSYQIDREAEVRKEALRQIDKEVDKEKEVKLKELARDVPKLG